MRLRNALPLLACGLCFLSGARAQLSIDTSTASDWKIANGSLTLDWDSTTGSVWSMYLNGSTTDLVDTTTIAGDGHPDGLYMDNTGSNAGGVTPTASYHLDSGHYLDWWISYAANSSNPFTVTEHFILQPNDATIYSYYVVNHASTAAAANFGQIQYVYRINLTQFVDTYSVNSGLDNTGATEIVLPSQTDLQSTDPGRAVQNAAEDLHGFSLPSGFGREFYTKYDYSSYEYLHQAHGVYGATYGAWTILPSKESFSGGPTKQDLIFTENILMGEIFSSHLDNSLTYAPPTGVDSTRIFGPVGFHFNQFNGGTITTPAQMYQDALNTIPSALTLFTSDSILTGAGYTASTGRGTVAPFLYNGGSSTANTAWTVLSDQNKNFQYSSTGLEYWQAQNTDGDATVTGVVPGTYRLSSYILGQWGEVRVDGVSVTSGGTTDVHATFTPENFSGDTPIWTIGTPDRSAHEFLHGKNSSGADDREFYGNWNYWNDFAANSGAVVYYATAVGSHAATGNLNDWNYNQWGVFDPGLYAEVYNSSDDTTDGYEYVIPSYVAGLTGHTGTNGVTTPVPAWTVHFTSTSAQLAQGSYVDLSVALAAVEGSLTVSLNGHAITWHVLNSSDASIRSGLSGYYQWIAYEWPTSDLSAAGADNVLTFSVSQPDGVMYDALRMEISPSGANPSTTGWHDYEYVTPSTYTAANDAVANN